MRRTRISKGDGVPRHSGQWIIANQLCQIEDVIVAACIVAEAQMAKFNDVAEGQMAKLNDENAEVGRTNITGKRKSAEYTPSGLQVIGSLNGSTQQSGVMSRLIRSHSVRRRWRRAKGEIS